MYLKTAFCCMACDGDIAQQELDTIASLSPLTDSTRLQALLNTFVEQIKTTGVNFLRQYLGELKDANLNVEEEKLLVSIAVRTIEADSAIEYNEIAFFKKIRSRIKASDEVLLSVIPENPAVSDQISPEDYLSPDIEEKDDLSCWNNLDISNVTAFIRQEEP